LVANQDVPQVLINLVGGVILPFSSGLVIL
jgi:hypothetical protein